MRDFLLYVLETVKEFILVEYVELKEFVHNPNDLPPLEATLISIVIIIAVITILYILLFSSYSIFVLLGLTRKAHYWGIVYNSVTKEPLDPAIVELRDSVGKRVGNAITDMDGRYSFPSQISGLYTLTAKKTNYVFPSQKLVGHTEDGIYSDLYFGEQLSISKDQNVIIKNIPLDPIGFDWNEQEKKEHHLFHSYSKHRIFLKFTTHWLFITCLIITVVASILLSAPYNYLIYIPLVLFIGNNIIRAYSVSSLPFGMVVEKENGMPLKYALVNIFYATPSAQPIKFGTKKCDYEGKYYCLLPQGRYFVTIEKWNPNQKYTHVYTSSPFSVSNGILNQTFKV